MKVHPATLKKAKQNGVILTTLADNTWLAEHKKTGTSDSNYNPKVAVDSVLKLVKDASISKTQKPKIEKTDEVTVTKSVVKPAYKIEYKNNGGNCGDELAKALANAYSTDPKAFNKICAENGVDHKKWSHLNTGLQHMSLSNSLRGSYKHGVPVIVLGKTLKSPKKT